MSGLEIADVDDDDDSYRAVMKGEGQKGRRQPGMGRRREKSPGPHDKIPFWHGTRYYAKKRIVLMAESSSMLVLFKKSMSLFLVLF